jgi:hypothetical protein
MENTSTATVRTEKAYFRNDPQFGRTTRLIINGKAVLEVMGIATKRQMMGQWNADQSLELSRKQGGLSR